jgi:hypothetical protein
VTTDNIRQDIRDISLESGIGDLSTMMQNLFYGINTKGTLSPIPANSDHHGLTFFTRPRLNLSYHNIISDRRMSGLAVSDKFSLKRAIRAYLDPVSNRGIGTSTVGGLYSVNGSNAEVVDSPIVDPLNPFIPLLSGTCLSISGWPDEMGRTFVSDEGVMGEQYVLMDDRPWNYSNFSISANFKNIIGDPISLLFHNWVVYAKLVHAGIYIHIQILFFILRWIMTLESID